MNRIGTVYLLHFSSPFSHACHYLGWGRGDASKRIANHLAGKGSALTRAAHAAGITFTVVRIWPDVDRNFERALKNKKNAKGLCPICKVAYNEKAKLAMRKRRARVA